MAGSLIAAGFGVDVAWPLVVALALGALLPVLGFWFFDLADKGKGLGKDARTSSAAHALADDDAADSGNIEDEEWAPKLEQRDWRHAAELPGCPWDFDGCADLASAVSKIWREPLSEELRRPAERLRSSTKALRVVRVSVGVPAAVHFAAVYRLEQGFELFGGAPLEQLGLDLPDDDEDEEDSSPSRTRTPVQVNRDGLPCLGQFYRIHDGFGRLNSALHLPLVLDHPRDEMQGSVYYVLPARALEPVFGARHLVSFARVDARCLACADMRSRPVGVSYVERLGAITEDEDGETPLSFAADTVDSLAGRWSWTS
eukprot:TRINITY_DN30130_c0_g1_i1.p1 TRINITY_DN30130_c0_g1~~TRINITY_DN30130_c0_g1_i1.p1  ORF type:complete len:314 (+),score=74.64 TRINITY_DN30130_c0_g1_i1:63-1004(+)